MEVNEHIEIEQNLHYRFNAKSLLEEALRHSSFVNEQEDPNLRDNERLEFLGDAVLNLIIGHILMQRYPELKEGDLSRTRANLVNESKLAKIARSIDLGSYIRLGKGEIQTKGSEKNSILADTFEAIIAAIYLDGGFDAVFRIIEANFLPFLNSHHPAGDHHDYKSKLQELAQEQQGTIPQYTVIREEGPDHDKTFWIALKVFDIEAQGSGKSKKTAEQDAARQAIEILKKESQ
jgi:ribonuclease III